MPLQGQAKTAYQREYMRRRRAAERASSKPTAPPTRAPPDFLVAIQAALDRAEETAKRCSFCNKPASKPGRVVVRIDSDDGKTQVSICEFCIAEVADLSATQRERWLRATG